MLGSCLLLTTKVHISLGVLGQSDQRLFGGVAGSWFVPTLNNEGADQP